MLVAFDDVGAINVAVHRTSGLLFDALSAPFMQLIERDFAGAGRGVIKPHAESDQRELEKAFPGWTGDHQCIPANSSPEDAFATVLCAHTCGSNSEGSDKPRAHRYRLAPH